MFFKGGNGLEDYFKYFIANFLIKLLCNSGKGCNIYNIRAVCPTYADDVAVIAPTKSTLQELVYIVENYSFQWRIQFNPAKCIYMEFCSANSSLAICNTKTSVKLGGKLIEQTEFSKHLGVGLGC